MRVTVDVLCFEDGPLYGPLSEPLPSTGGYTLYKDDDCTECETGDILVVWYEPVTDPTFLVKF